MSIPGTPSILKILLAQAAASAGLAGILAVWQGQIVGVSTGLGGAVAVIPNAFLAARLMTPKAGRTAQAMLRAAWLGEIGKLVLTAILFGAVFAMVRPLSALAVFGGYIAAQVVVFGALLVGGTGTVENKATTKS